MKTTVCLTSIFARAIPVLMAALALFVGIAVPAGAAESYAVTEGGCVSGSSFGSGSVDRAGVVYVSCGSSIARFDGEGQRLADIALAGPSPDAAPSPDGAYVYHWRSGELRRMERQPDGSYRSDPDWTPAAFSYYGESFTPRGRFVVTDAWGRIYVSNGSWSPGHPNKILVLDPDGSLVTSFGDWGPEQGFFYTNMGIGVSRDGRSIFTVENTAGRVQRFDLQADGSYLPAATWGETDTDCATLGNFAAPYDVGVDAWGAVYVMDTSCIRVQKFDRNGNQLGVVPIAPPTSELRAHGIAVDARGDAYVPQGGLKLVRQGAAPAAAPAPTPIGGVDAVAPVVTSASASAVDGAISVAAQTHDDVAVAGVRVGTAADGWGAWGSLVLTAPDGGEISEVWVQAKDAFGNVSTPVRSVVGAPAEPAEATPPAVPAPAPAQDSSGFVPHAPAAVPAVPARIVDRIAPKIRNIRAVVVRSGRSGRPFAGGTASRGIALRVAASDNVAVTHVRFRVAGSRWSRWQRFGAQMQLRLSGRNRTKRKLAVAVQVRDTAKNVSKPRRITVRR